MCWLEPSMRISRFGRFKYLLIDAGHAIAAYSCATRLRSIFILPLDPRYKRISDDSCACVSIEREKNWFAVLLHNSKTASWVGRFKWNSCFTYLF